jgi:DNA-directed RNA polymerase specialized sigma24 family protein
MSSRIFIEDQILVDRLNLNDTEAFEELYRRHWHGLYIYCFKKLHSAQDARIIVRDIFRDIWGKRNSLSVSFSLTRHLYQEVRNHVIKCLNQKLTADCKNLESWLPDEFNIESLQAAKIPVKNKYTVINSHAELMRQEAIHATVETNTLDSIKLMIHSLSAKLSLINILSYPKN